MNHILLTVLNKWPPFLLSIVLISNDKLPEVMHYINCSIAALTHYISDLKHFINPGEGRGTAQSARGHLVSLHGVSAVRNIAAR